jgi:hypothetical protein
LKIDYWWQRWNPANFMHIGWPHPPATERPSLYDTIYVIKEHSPASDVIIAWSTTSQSRVTFCPGAEVPLKSICIAAYGERQPPTPAPCECCQSTKNRHRRNGLLIVVRQMRDSNECCRPSSVCGQQRCVSLSDKRMPMSERDITGFILLSSLTVRKKIVLWLLFVLTSLAIPSPIGSQNEICSRIPQLHSENVFFLRAWLNNGHYTFIVWLTYFPKSSYGKVRGLFPLLLV